MNHKLVRVEWEDSSSSSRVWNTKEYLSTGGNQRCVSVGFLVHEDKDCVVIAGHMGLNDRPDFAGDMRIPKSAIRSRRKMRHG